MARLFPGMDPFLEDPAFWPQFHAKFINYWEEALAEVLPDQFEASQGERVYLAENDPDTRKLVYPDVALSEEESASSTGSRQTGGIATLEPVTLPLVLLDGPRESYIEILQRPHRTLVAVLELLSPGNKEQPGRAEYLAKRNALLHQHVHLIELDLLLGGKRLPMGQPLPPGSYYYFLSRAEERPSSKVYSWDLPHSLPTLPVPLRPPFADVMIDLEKVFDVTFERGRYQRRLDYGSQCRAPIPQQWWDFMDERQRTAAVNRSEK